MKLIFLTIGDLEDPIISFQLVTNPLDIVRELYWSSSDHFLEKISNEHLLFYNNNDGIYWALVESDEYLSKAISEIKTQFILEVNKGDFGEGYNPTDIWNKHIQPQIDLLQSNS